MKDEDALLDLADDYDDLMSMVDDLSVSAEEYIKAQISTLERLSKHRTLTSEEMHDLCIMKDQLNNNSFR